MHNRKAPALAAGHCSTEGPQPTGNCVTERHQKGGFGPTRRLTSPCNPEGPGSWPTRSALHQLVLPLQGLQTAHHSASESNSSRDTLAPPTPTAAVLCTASAFLQGWQQHITQPSKAIAAVAAPPGHRSTYAHASLTRVRRQQQQCSAQPAGLTNSSPRSHQEQEQHRHAVPTTVLQQQPCLCRTGLSLSFSLPSLQGGTMVATAPHRSQDCYCSREAALNTGPKQQHPGTIEQASGSIVARSAGQPQHWQPASGLQSKAVLLRGSQQQQPSNTEQQHAMQSEKWWASRSPNPNAGTA